MRCVLLSGGLDSACALADQLGKYGDEEKIVPVFVDYGQRNAEQERKAAEAICKDYSLPLEIISAPSLFAYAHSTLLGGRKARVLGLGEHRVDTDELVGRNAVLITVAVSNLYRTEDDGIVIVAAHRTSAPYADCTPGFYTKINRLVSYMTNGRWEVQAPYIKMTKYQLLKTGWNAGMTREQMETTVSCYEGNNCGQCPACKQRKEVLEKLFF